MVALEDVVSWCVERQSGGVLEILGGAKSGKTTALRHLAALPCADKLTLLDDAAAHDVRWASSDRLVVYTTRHRLRLTSLEYKLAAWSVDDLIEYLLAAHAQKCSAVMARFVASRDRLLLAGAPLLYCRTAELLAADDSLPSVAEALRRAVAECAGDDQTLHACGLWAAGAAVGDVDARAIHAGHSVARHKPEELFALLGFASVQTLIAASWFLDHFKAPGDFPYVVEHVAPELVAEMALLGQSDAILPSRLRERLAEPSGPAHAVVASVLHRLDPLWRPRKGSYLVGAYLAGANWNGARLATANLMKADLGGAELTRADLTQAKCTRTSFAGCDLTGASMCGIRADEADFTGAKLSHAQLRRAQLMQAVFAGAVLDDARATAADFRRANLRGASLRRAQLRRCGFQQATLEGADFTSADLRRANLSDLQLGETRLDGANLANAILCRSVLEFDEIREARFTNANLTAALLSGSIMRGGDFRGASLRQTGLADIDWEQADLRGADLRGCSFHLGSTRSGLVGSPYPGHGSRTGFYTNDYDEQSFKAPEEIRKANLRGADLRGARIAGVDFYLVDLRDALYDPEQWDHFRRCQAILLTQ